MQKKSISRFKKMLKPYRKILIIVTIMALLIDICELIKPVLVKEIMEKYLPNQVFEQNGISIAIICIAYLGIVLIGNIIDYINRITTSKIGEDVVYGLRSKLYKYIEKSNITFHDKTPSGKLFVRVVNDTEDVYCLFSDVITTFPKDVIIIIGLLIVMICLSIQLSLVNILVIPLILIVSITITKALNKIYAKSKEVRTKLNTFLAESIYGVKLIKIFNRQKEKQEECERCTTEHRNINGGINNGNGYGMACKSYRSRKNRGCREAFKG